jgi:hypothetical protein
MDDRRFDNLARGLADAGWSRRGLVGVLSGASSAPLLGWAPEAAALAAPGPDGRARIVPRVGGTARGC